MTGGGAGFKHFVQIKKIIPKAKYVVQNTSYKIWGDTSYKISIDIFVCKSDSCGTRKWGRNSSQHHLVWSM